MEIVLDLAKIGAGLGLGIAAVFVVPVLILFGLAVLVVVVCLAVAGVTLSVIWCVDQWDTFWRWKGR